MRFGEKWYVEITPTYHFTQDGWKLSRYFDERLSGIKQLERQNKTHLRQVRLWEEVLRQAHLVPSPPKPRQRSLFDDEVESEAPITPYLHLSFDPLVSFEVDWGVPESAWLPQPAGEEDQEGASDQRSLFD